MAPSAAIFQTGRSLYRSIGVFLEEQSTAPLLPLGFGKTRRHGPLDHCRLTPFQHVTRLDSRAAGRQIGAAKDQGERRQYTDV
jgi:hypothetical protein